MYPSLTALGLARLVLILFVLTTVAADKKERSPVRLHLEPQSCGPRSLELWNHEPPEDDEGPTAPASLATRRRNIARPDGSTDRSQP